MEFKINRIMLAAMLTVSMSGIAAHADDDTATAESKAKLPPSPSANAVEGADKVDEILTNANLRAMSGSKSKWSFASSFNYDGGTLDTPFGQGRPNIANASATSINTDINGQLNVKYNADALNSFFLGFGVRKMAPFSFKGPSADYQGKDVDAYNPSVTYQYIYKLGGIQSVAQLGVMKYTQADSVHSSYGMQYSFDQENIYDVGDSGLSVGGSIGISTNTFTINDGTQDPNQSVYQAWFDPYVEYKLNELMNLRTVFNMGNYELYRGQSNSWIHDTVIQSVGVGFSITRDIFVYPNMQFRPDHFTKNETNIGTSATINLF